MKSLLPLTFLVVSIGCGHTLIIKDSNTKQEIECHEEVDSQRLLQGIDSKGVKYFSSEEEMLNNYHPKYCEFKDIAKK
jgi:hypothetical protein